MDIETRIPIDVLTRTLLPEIALTALMAIRAPFALKATISLILLGNILHILLTATTGDTYNDYALGSAVLAGTFFDTLLFVWIIDPMEEYRYLHDDDPSPLASRSFLARFFSSLCIIRNRRLIGLNVQASNIPPPFKGTRTQFLRYRLLQLLSSFILSDLAESYIQSYRHLYVPGATDPPLPTGLSGFFLRSWNLLVFGAAAYAILKMYYEVGSLFAVGCGFSAPQDWPDMFGKLTDAYTVGRLWGRTWHQSLRRHFSAWGKLVVRTLRIPRRTRLSLMVQVWTAFLISALVHSFGDIMIGKQYFDRSFPFFLSQAAAITFEQAVIVLAKSFGVDGRSPTRLMKMLGYAWVVLWMRFSAPMFVNWMFESGMTENSVLPFSPVRSLVRPWLHRSLGAASL